MTHFTGSLAALAIVLLAVSGSAVGYSCYTVDYSSMSSTSVTLSQTPDTGNLFTGCISYTVSGTMSQNGQTLVVAGTSGQGFSVSGGSGCADLPSNITATIQNSWNSIFTGSNIQNNVKFGTVACCASNYCNTGLSLTIKQGAASMYALSFVNMLVLAAVALISFNLST